MVALAAPALDSTGHCQPSDETDSKASYGILLFYEYATVGDVSGAVQQLRAVCERLSLTGRLRLSREGCNGNLSGTWQACEEWPAAARAAMPELRDTDFKLAPCEHNQLFRGLKVWESDEVCGLFASCGEDRVASAQSLEDKDCGTHLKPEDWHAALERGGDDLVLFDCRNAYETRIGRFQAPGDEVSWVDPGTRFFKDIPDYFSQEDNLVPMKGKRVFMYCTGGVRCERASSLLKQKLDGSGAEVFQLEGGIQRYMDAFPDGGYFAGSMHVFDRRGYVPPPGAVSIGADDKVERHVLGRCVRCSTAWESYQAKWRCSVCDQPVLACTSCQGDSAVRASAKCELCMPAQPAGSAEAGKPVAAKSSTKKPTATATPSLDTAVRRLLALAAHEATQAPEEQQDDTLEDLLPRLKDWSKSRRKREVLLADKRVAAAVRTIFDNSLQNSDGPAGGGAKIAGLCVELMELWLHDQSTRVSLHQAARPEQASLMFLAAASDARAFAGATGDDARPSLASCSALGAALRSIARLAELREARVSLEKNAAAWAAGICAIVQMALGIIADPASGSQLMTAAYCMLADACTSARATAEHLNFAASAPPGDAVTHKVLATAEASIAAAALGKPGASESVNGKGKEAAEATALAGAIADATGAALSAAWALQAVASHPARIAGLAVRALRVHSFGPVVQRWSCALLLQLTHSDAAREALQALGDEAPGLAERAMEASGRNAAAKSAAERLLAALRGRSPPAQP